MKHRSNISTLRLGLLATLMLICNAAWGNQTLEKARQLREKAGAKVEAVKENISGLDADSIAETVVYEVGDADSCTIESASESRDESELYDKTVDRVTSSLFPVVPIVGIIVGTTVPFAAVVLVFLIVFNSKTRRKKMKYDIIGKAIDAGCPLPDSFYRSEAPVVKNRLQSGIVWCGWGLAFMFYGGVSGWYVLVAMGIIPAFIGLSRIAVYYVDYKRSTKGQAEAEVNDDAE